MHRTLGRLNRHRSHAEAEVNRTAVPCSRDPGQDSRRWEKMVTSRIFLAAFLIRSCPSRVPDWPGAARISGLTGAYLSRHVVHPTDLLIVDGSSLLSEGGFTTKASLFSMSIDNSSTGVVQCDDTGPHACVDIDSDQG